MDQKIEKKFFFQYYSKKFICDFHPIQMNYFLWNFNQMN